MVESIPEGMDYGNETINPSIFESWLQLIEMAESSIDIAAFYFSLNGVDVVPHPSAWQVYKMLSTDKYNYDLQTPIFQKQNE